MQVYLKQCTKSIRLKLFKVSDAFEVSDTYHETTNITMINNPYDKIIKFAFKNKDEAEIFFRNFLPNSIVKKLVFETLELDECSYIDENLEQDYSDVVYNVLYI